MDAIQNLRDIGLLVVESGSNSSFAIAKPESTTTIRLLLKKDSWLLYHLDHIPYPGRDDFSCNFDSLDDAAISVKNFFFGEPVIKGNWSIPSHRHPELKMEGIEHVLNQAIKISPDNYTNIKENYWRKFAEMMETYRNDLSRAYEDMWDDVWHQVYSHQFLEVLNVQDSNKVLYLRRDLQVAYIVEKR